MNVIPKRMDYGISRACGMHFEISEGKGKGGGLKHGSHLWLGMDIFWNCPIKLILNYHHVGEKILSVMALWEE